MFLLGLGIWALVDKNFNEIWKGLADGNLAGQLPDLKGALVSALLVRFGPTRASRPLGLEPLDRANQYSALVMVVRSQRSPL